MKLVAAGAVEPDDPDLREQLRAAEARRRRADEEIALIEAQAGDCSPKAITPAKIERLGDAIRQALQSGGPEFRRAYLRLFVGKAIVGDQEIQVSGPTAALAQAAATNSEQILGPESSHFHRVWRRKGN
jgi:hypothetical protein